MLSAWGTLTGFVIAELEEQEGVLEVNWQWNKLRSGLDYGQCKRETRITESTHTHRVLVESTSPKSYHFRVARFTRKFRIRIAKGSV